MIRQEKQEPANDTNRPDDTKNFRDSHESATFGTVPGLNVTAQVIAHAEWGI